LPISFFSELVFPHQVCQISTLSQKFIIKHSYRLAAPAYKWSESNLRSLQMGCAGARAFKVGEAKVLYWF